MTNEQNTLIGIWILLILILIMVIAVFAMLINMSKQSWKSEGGEFYKGQVSDEFKKRYGIDQ